MSVEGDEGAAAGLALVLDHAADAHGAVEELVQLLGLLRWGGLGVVVGKDDAEALLGEFLYGTELGCGNAFVEQAEVFECLLLQVEEEAGQHFLVNDGGVFHPVGHHVVDVFDEDDVGALFVEVLDEGSVATGAEDEASFVVANGFVLLVDGDDVGIVFLLGEGDVEFDVKGMLVEQLDLGHFLAEEGAVLGRDGEMDVDGVVALAGVFGSLDNVLFERGALGVAVAVEFEQAFGKAAVAHVLLLE